MSNLYDLIPIQAAKIKAVKSNDPNVATMLQKVATFDSLDTMRELSTSSEYEGFAKPVVTRLVNEFNSLRANIFRDSLTLPEGMLTSLAVGQYYAAPENKDGYRDRGWVGLGT